MITMSDVQFVDPFVTRQKFLEELNKFNQLKEHYRGLGVLLVGDTYPNLYFAFAALSLQPIPILFAVQINFTNYDVQPLSVKFVHPLNLLPVLISEVPTRLPRKISGNGHQELLQSQIDQVPFFCIPGVREYHKHTFHNGDSWFLHRGRAGEGSLCFLLDNLQLYGTSAVNSFTIQVVNLQTQKMNLGYNINSIPE